MAEKSRPVYCVGPMIPRGAFVNAVEKRQSDCAVEVDDFLTSTLERQGAGSLLYVRQFSVPSSDNNTEPRHLDKFRYRTLVSGTRESLGLLEYRN